MGFRHGRRGGRKSLTEQLHSGADQSPAAIGRRLREARETLGITQDSTATALGIPRTSVSAIEKGTRNVSTTELVRLSELYRRSSEWILGTETAAPAAAAALFRATKALTPAEQEQVVRFAEFLASGGSNAAPNQAE